MNVMSIDVEEWFHILDSPATPSVETWHRLEPRLQRNVEKLLALLDETNTRATFFWLGWAAERYKGLLRRCRDAGHEIGSHGYGHIACSKVGPRRFYTDIVHARQVLEDILCEPVTCFRAPGFAIDGCTDWCFDTIRAAGYTCDSSAPAVGMVHVRGCVENTGTYVVETETGPLVEVPISSFSLAGGLVWTFGGGYFRIAPWTVLSRASKQIHQSDKPIVVYIHPRDIDPESPCLPLGPWQRFKFAVNRQTTITKLRSLLTTYQFRPVRGLYKPTEHLPAHGLSQKAEFARTEASGVTRPSSSRTPLMEALDREASSLLKTGSNNTTCPNTADRGPRRAPIASAGSVQHDRQT